jgi:hypothetical protein
MTSPAGMRNPTAIGVVSDRSGARSRSAGAARDRAAPQAAAARLRYFFFFSVP